MKKFKRAICLLMSLLMIPIGNLSVNAEKTYSENLAQYWYQGVPFGWTGFSAGQTVNGSWASFPMTDQNGSFTNSQGEEVQIPKSSYYSDEYHRAAKLTYESSGIDTYLSHASWFTDKPDLTPLMENGYLRVELYFDGTEEQANNMSFYLRNTSYAASREFKFNVFKPMQWSECLIPLESLVSETFTGGTMGEFRIKTTSGFSGSCNVYIHEIGFKTARSGYKLTHPIYTDSRWGFRNPSGTYVDKEYHMWSTSVNNSVGEYSTEKNTGVGESVKYDIKKLQDTYTDKDTKNIELPLQSGNTALDISSISSSAYLSFDMYVATNQNVGNSDMTVALCDANGTLASYTPFNVKKNEWQTVTLKVSDMNPTRALTAVNGVRFKCGSTITEDYKIYVQNLGIALPIAPEFTAVEKTNDGVVLTWDKGIMSETANYYIYKDGKKIAEAEKETTSYTDTEVVDGIVNYTISAVDSNGKVLSTSPEKLYKEYNPRYSVFASLYKNSNGGCTGPDGNWYNARFGTWNNALGKDVGTFTTEKAIIGGKSVKYDMQALNNPDILLPLFDSAFDHDISSIVNSGYVRFAIYVDSEQELSDDALRFRLRQDSGSIHSFTPFKVEENKWQIVKVKLSDLISNPQSATAVSGIEFQCVDTATGKLSLYIQEIDFIDDAAPKITSVEKAGQGISVKWTCGNVEGLNKFNVVCNGEVIATVNSDVNEYTHALKVDGIYNYKIEALDANSNVMFASDISTYKEYDSEYKVKAELYTNHNEKKESLNWAYQFGTWNNALGKDVGTFTTEKAIIGGKSVKYDMQALNDNTIILPLFDSLNDHDISSIVNSGYLRFAIYVDSEQELSDDALRFRLRHDGGKIHDFTTFKVEENMWQAVTVKLSDLISNPDNAKAVSGIEFQCVDTATGKLSLYIQDIVFVAKQEIVYDNVDQTETDGTSLFNTFFVNKNVGYTNSQGQWVNSMFGTWNNSLQREVGIFTNEKTKHGGVSVKYDLYNNGSPLAAKTQLPIFMTEGGVDISEICRDGYLKMSMFVEADEDLDGTLSVSFVNREGRAANSGAIIKIDKLNEWLDISMSLADCDMDPEATDEIYQIVFSYSNAATSKLNFYMQNIRFCTPQLFSGLSIIDEYGEKVTGVEAGKKYSVELTCLNHTGADIEPTVIAALYDGGRFVEAKNISDKVFSGKKALFEVRNIEVPETALIPVLKVFVWDGFDTMVPYTIYDTVVKHAGDYDQRIYGDFTIQNNIASDLAANAVIMRANSTSAVVNGNIKKIDLTEKNIYPFVSAEDEGYKVPMHFILSALEFDAEEASKTEVVADLGDETVSICANDETFGTFVYNGILYGDLNKVADRLSCNVEIVDDMAYVSASELEVENGVNSIISNELGYNWGNIYLDAEGYVTGMVIHPNNSDIRYVKTDVGGMYKYDTVRSKWIPLLDSIPNKYSNLMCVRGIALDPNDENVIYAACGGKVYTSSPHDVLKSVDGGKTWKRLNFSGGQFDGNNGYIRLSGECIAVDPSDSDRVYVGTSNNGLFVSNNAGKSFSKIESVPSTGVTENGGVTFVLIQGDDVYCGLYGKGIYMSSDSGKTFTYVEGSPQIPVRAQFENNKLYVSARGDLGYTGGLFIYENGTWKDITPDEKQVDGIGAFFVRDNTIFADVSPYSTASDPTYRSTDNGATWNVVKKDGEVYSLNPSCFVADPNNSNAFWAPWGFGIEYIVDNGDNTITTTKDHANIEELCATSLMSNPSEYAPMLNVQVLDRGMLASDHENRLPKNLEPTIQKVSGMDFCEGDSSYVVSAGFVSHDSDSECIVVVSEDYGYTFEEINWNNGQIIDVAMSADENNGSPAILILATGENRGIYRTNNMGKTWTKCDVEVTTNTMWDFPNRFLASDRVDGNTFYFLEDRNLYVTRDAGATWTLAHTFKASQRGERYNAEFIKAIPYIEGGLWVRHSDGIYASYNFGDTWSLIPEISDVLSFGFGLGIEDETVSSYALGTIDGIFGMYISDNFGSTWRRISNGATPFVGDISDITGDRKVYGRVYVVESGRGVFFGEPIGSDGYGPVINLNISRWRYQGAGVYADKAIGSYTISGTVDRKANVTIDGVPVNVNDDNSFSKTISVGFSKTITIEATDENGLQDVVTLELSMIN